MAKTLDIDIGQFMLDTIGFRPEVLGAYVRLLIAYRAGGPLDINTLERISGLDEAGWEWARESIEPLFETNQGDGCWHRPDIDEQISKSNRLRGNAAKASTAAAAARTGAAAKPRTVLEILSQSEVDEPDAPPPFTETPRVETQQVQFGKPADDMGSPLSPEFMLTGAEVSQCRGEGYSSDEIGDVLDSFKRYHIAAGTLSTDWHASWGKWWERKKPEKPKAKPRVEVSRRAPKPPEGTDAAHS